MYICNFTVEIDSDSEKVSERLFHRLFETILEEDYVLALAAEMPIPGSLAMTEE